MYVRSLEVCLPFTSGTLPKATHGRGWSVDHRVTKGLKDWCALLQEFESIEHAQKTTVVDDTHSHAVGVIFFERGWFWIGMN